MGNVFVLVSMIFLHIVDDYYLQGILASMKQKSWWEENAPQRLYKYDYIVALTMHSLSWAFMIMLPIAIQTHLNVGNAFLCALIVNAIVHGVVDDIKANKLKINLIIDQTIHIVQIVVTFIINVHFLGVV